MSAYPTYAELREYARDYNASPKRRYGVYDPDFEFRTVAQELAAANKSKDGIPLIDRFVSCHCWGAIDGGCNSTTHNEGYRLNMEVKQARYGLVPYRWSSKTSSYSALGDAKIETTGSWEIAIAFYSYPPEWEDKRGKYTDRLNVMAIN